MKGTISLSWGKYGGFYFNSDYTVRLCLGWIAITYLPLEIDDILYNPEKYTALATAQKEYIVFLEETIGDIAVIKKFINKSISQDLIDKGRQLHNKIAELENN